MVIDVQGVYQNGTAPLSTAAPLVPVEVPVSIPAGADVTIRLTVVDPAGAAVDITGATFGLALREFDFDADPIIDRAGSIITAGSGRANLVLVPGDTKDLPFPNRYRWGLWMALAGKAQPLILPSNWDLGAPGITADELGVGDFAAPAASGGNVADMAALALANAVNLGPGAFIYVLDAGSGVSSYFHIEVPATAPVVDGSTVVAALNLSGGYWVRGLPGA
jgi:hypothetical protein